MQEPQDSCSLLSKVKWEVTFASHKRLPNWPSCLGAVQGTQELQIYWGLSHAGVWFFGNTIAF